MVAYNDKDHGLVTAVLSMKRILLRSLMAVIASKKLSVYVRDAPKAFSMSQTPLHRLVFMKTLKGMNGERGKVVKVVRPVYCMPESPVRWCQTNTDYHKGVLGLKQSSIDPCFVFASTDGELEGFVEIQVDDTICAGSYDLAKEEGQKYIEFPCKGQEMVQEENVKLNAIEILLNGDVLYIQ